MTRTRAKFKCNWVKDHGNNIKIVQLGVVCCKDPATKENGDFTRYTPNGHIEMQIDNPAAACQFTPGSYYYVDITECPPMDKQEGENLNPKA